MTKKTKKNGLTTKKLEDTLRDAGDLFSSITGYELFCFEKEGNKLCKQLDYYYNIRGIQGEEEMDKARRLLTYIAKFLKLHITSCDEIFHKNVLKTAQKIIDAAERV